MSDKVYLGKNAARMETSPAFDAYSKVVIIAGEDGDGNQIVYEAGDDTGRTLEVTNPLIYDEEEGKKIAADMLARIKGYAYQPFTATGALLDPAAELGDGITVNGTYSVLASQDTRFGALSASDIAAPAGGEIDHEYPYESSAMKQIERRIAQTRVSFKVGMDAISAEVAGVYADEWASGVTYYKSNIVKVTSGNSVSYYRCTAQHTSSATNKPPSGNWTFVTSPNVQSILNIGLSGITLSYENRDGDGNNSAYITLNKDGVMIEGRVIRMGNVVAESVSADWVYAGEIKADQITSGTIAAENLTALEGMLNITTSSGVPVGSIGGLYQRRTNMLAIRSKNDAANFGLIELDVGSGIRSNAAIKADAILLDGTFRVSKDNYGILTEFDDISSPVEGQVYFLI